MTLAHSAPFIHQYNTAVPRQTGVGRSSSKLERILMGAFTHGGEAMTYVEMKDCIKRNFHSTDIGGVK